jgi:septal ring factor EnvC (AmiA/AmiB activator)
MKKDNLKQLFENLKDEFDIEIPNLGHQNRFLSKLNGEDSKIVKVSPMRLKLWKPLTAIAATLLICFSLITILNSQPVVNDLASISPEMSKTQDFFTSTIESELNKLNKERTPETKALIDDAMKQMKILESDYDKLKKDLTESGDDKRVIYAMISNFQNRINVLQTVLEQIETIKQFKQTTL